MTWILVLLLLLCALYLLFLYGIFRFVFWNSDDRKKKGPSLPKGPGYDSWREDMAALVGLMEEQVPTEQIRIMAEDGTILCGRYYAGEEDAPVEILFHGYRGGAVRCGICAVPTKSPGSTGSERSLWTRGRTERAAGT